MQRSTESICEEDQAQPRGGPSSKSRRSHEEDQAQMVTTQGLERQESTQVMWRRSSVKGVDTAHKAQGCQAGEAPEQYSMKKVLSGERAGAASLAML